MAIDTVRSLATASLVEIGVLAAGETMVTADATTALDALNALVDQFKAERLQIHTTTRTVWSIVASTQDYTLGTGGTINVARPVYIAHVALQDTTDSPVSEAPLNEMTDAAWQAVSQKTVTSPEPTDYYYNPTYPLGTLSLYPTPTGTTLQGVLYAPAAIAEFATLDTSVALPPGYRRMLIKNLALELCAPYDRQPTALLVRQALEATQVVKRSNVRPVDMVFSPDALIGGGKGSFDIRTGE